MVEAVLLVEVEVVAELVVVVAKRTIVKRLKIATKKNAGLS